LIDQNIVRCVIHPGIGIARVGNSPDEFFVGPEVPGVAPPSGDAYKDAQGQVKRQAARFRIYGLDATGTPVAELTPADADITWTVHLANKKAAWYEFRLALDIDAAQGLQVPRRNARTVGADRAQLVIDPGPRSVSGQNAPAVPFDTGTFRGTAVTLGELRTDDAGSLLVLGGAGVSDTPLANNPVTRFANNDGWYDDIADGPVSAAVVIGGRTLDVTPAWVIVAPPNFAPGIDSLVTLYDLLLDMSPDQQPAQVSFTQHVLPILRRFSRFQWVNLGFFQQFGWRAEDDWLDPATLALLASSDPGTQGLRQSVVSRFRAAGSGDVDSGLLPDVYGDGFDLSPHFVTVTPTQYGWLGRWASGDFLADWTPDGPPGPQALEDLPVAMRPTALDQAALDACAGGPFHPGCEATWPMRVTFIYADFCRVDVRSDDDPEPDYGDVLTTNIALGPNGPLQKSGPGDLTRWMALPWQADTASCRFAYEYAGVPPPPNPYLPTFWPARVPNHVLTQAAYQRVMDTSLSDDQRTAAFADRQNWFRHLPSDQTDPIPAMNDAITQWSLLGVVSRQDGPGDLASLPTDLYVETDSGFPEAAAARAAAAVPPEHHLRINPRLWK
jgi:hypothetical protein